MATVRVRLHRMLATIGAVALVLAAPALAAPAAHAAGPTATIGGTVTDSHDAPVTDATVHLFAKQGEGAAASWVEARNVSTGADGGFAFTGLPANPDGSGSTTYTLEFEASPSSGLATQWWSGVDGLGVAHVPFDYPNSFDLGDGIAETDFDISLPAAASLDGRVTSDGGVPAEDVTVSLMRQIGGEWLAVDEQATGGDGTYSFTGRGPGAYYLSFEPGDDSGLVGEWWDDVPTDVGAQVVMLQAGQQRTGLDAELTRVGGAVHGTVKTTEGEPVAGAVLTIYPAGGTGAADEEAGSTRSDENGAFSLDGVDPGTYRLRITPGSADSTLLPQWWTGAADFDHAASLTLTDGGVPTVVDATLRTESTISGVVTGPGGTPVEGVVVSAGVRAGGNWTSVRDAVTDADGGYTVDGLPAGSYVMFFQPSEASGLVASYWKNTIDLAAATLIVTTDGEDRSPVSQRLTTGDSIGASVSGHVRGGAIVEGHGQVVARRAQTPVDWVVEATTDIHPDGTYSFSGLTAGDYTFSFTDGRGSLSGGAAFAPWTEWYEDQLTQASATPVRLADGDARTDVDVDLDTVGTAPSWPRVSGALRVGATLTATTGAWAAGTTYAYQWYAGVTPIAGATGPRLTLGTAQLGKRIQLEVRGTLAAGGAQVKRSATTAIVAAGVLTAATPRISGTAKVGKKLTAVRGTWTAGASFSYQWYANGKAIKGATKPTYTLKSAQRGKKITVKVTGRKTGYVTAAKTSRSTAKVR